MPPTESDHFYLPKKFLNGFEYKSMDFLGKQRFYDSRRECREIRVAVSLVIDYHLFRGAAVAVATMPRSERSDNSIRGIVSYSSKFSASQQKSELLTNQ